jgi:hypothetical protein
MANEALYKTPALAGAGTGQLDRGITTPDIWSTKLNVHLYDRTFLKEITNSDWENEAKGPGDTIYVREIPTIPIHRVVPGQTRKRDRVKYTSIPIALDKTAGFDLAIDDVEKLQSDMNLQRDFLSGASKDMDVFMSADVLQTVYASAGETFELTTPDPEEFAQAYMKALMLLGKNKVDVEGEMDQLWSVASYDAMYLLGIGPQTKAQDMGTGFQSTYVTGKVARPVCGIKTYFSNQLAEVAGYTQILVGHKRAITWAMQMDKKVETLRNPDEMGDVIRGMCLYGYKVTKPPMLICISVKWPTI